MHAFRICCIFITRFKKYFQPDCSPWQAPLAAHLGETRPFLSNLFFKKSSGIHAGNEPEKNLFHGHSNSSLFNIAFFE
jgi:hypothetical protein